VRSEEWCLAPKTGCSAQFWLKNSRSEMAVFRHQRPWKQKYLSGIVVIEEAHLLRHTLKNTQKYAKGETFARPIAPQLTQCAISFRFPRTPAYTVFDSFVICVATVASTNQSVAAVSPAECLSTTNDLPIFSLRSSTALAERLPRI
jgi:hypothetical protein